MRILPEEIENVLGEKFNVKKYEGDEFYKIVFTLKDDWQISEESYNKQMDQAVKKLKEKNFNADRIDKSKRSKGVVRQTPKGTDEWYVSVSVTYRPTRFTVDLCKINRMGGFRVVKTIAKVDNLDSAKEISEKLIDERRANYISYPYIPR